MKTLYLLRHAKSRWDDSPLADHDRPLAPRGKRSSRRMASHIKRRRIRVDLVICSSAIRARQTLDIVAPALGEKCDIRVGEELYSADARGLLVLLKSIEDGGDAALLVGHNPALRGLALDLVADGVDEATRRLRNKFPTGALATLTTALGWDRLNRGVAHLESLVVPGEIPD